jgi:tetratricopeptide (TPR) repeat protein
MRMSVNASVVTNRATLITFLVVFLFLTAPLSLSAQNEKWAQWGAQADTLLSHDDFQGAIKLYSKIVKASKVKDKTSMGALYKRAVCYYSLGDFQNALKDLDVFIPLYPQVAQAHILRAFIYKDLHDNARQREALEQVLALQPSNPEVIKLRASINMDEEKYREAINDLLFVRTVKDDAETEVYLGYSYYYIQNMDSALIALNKSIELDPNYLPAYLYAGSFCLETGNYDLALKYLTIASRLDPKNTTVLFYKGIALVEKDNLDEGCSCLNKAFYAGEDDAGDYLTEYCYGSK